MSIWTYIFGGIGLLLQIIFIIGVLISSLVGMFLICPQVFGMWIAIGSLWIIANWPSKED